MTEKLIIDIETDGLAPTKVWLIGLKDYQTGLKTSLSYPYNVQEIQNVLNRYDSIITHNGIDFDIPVLERLLGLDFSKHTMVDTLVLSRLYNPQLEDGHSLKSWGIRLHFPKGEYDDWTQLTPEMIKYCEQDLDVTHRVYDTLIDRLQPFKGESIELEHDVQKIISQQMKNGWLLDQAKCYDLLAELKQRKMEVEDEVHEKFKPLGTFVKEVVPKYKKDGTLSIVGIRFLGDLWNVVSGPFSRIDFPEFNLGSRQQIGRYLQYFGWKPTNFTEKGSVIVDEDVLSKVQGIPEAKMIAEYLLIQKRQAQVTSWIEAVEDDGRVHGYVNAIGAVTGRMTHSSPNLAQVPAYYSHYGMECRSCWMVPKGKKLVGIDASGLELRMLAHYMNDKEYTNEIIDGDIHTRNQKSAGLSSRDDAKVFIYAFLYGAGDSKIGSIIGGGKGAGRKLKDQFIANTPAIKSLRERVDNVSVRGHLLGLDGRRLAIRSAHAALNTLLQGAGAVIMKKALTLLNFDGRIIHGSYSFLGNIHDEFQVEVDEDKAEEFGRIAVESIKAAGVHFNLRCPLDGNYKVGTTWADTH